MQNGSVQRASKRSYMGEATVHALTEDVVKVAKITNTLAERLVVAEQRIVDEQARATSNLNDVTDAIASANATAAESLSAVVAHLEALTVRLAALEGRVDSLSTAFASVAEEVLSLSEAPEIAEPADPTTTPAA